MFIITITTITIATRPPLAHYVGLMGMSYIGLYVWTLGFQQMILFEEVFKVQTYWKKHDTGVDLESMQHHPTSSLSLLDALAACLFLFLPCLLLLQPCLFLLCLLLLQPCLLLLQPACYNCCLPVTVAAMPAPVASMPAPVAACMLLLQP